MFPKPVTWHVITGFKTERDEVEKGGGGLAGEFEEVRMKYGVEYKSLDAWMVGVTKFVLRADILFDDNDEQERAGIKSKPPL